MFYSSFKRCQSVNSNRASAFYPGVNKKLGYCEQFSFVARLHMAAWSGLFVTTIAQMAYCPPDVVEIYVTCACRAGVRKKSISLRQRPNSKNRRM